MRHEPEPGFQRQSGKNDQANARKEFWRTSRGFRRITERMDTFFGTGEELFREILKEAY
jgi:hypothetical protein